MCSIMGSFSKKKIRELVALNQHRGSFSYSITSYDVETNLVHEQKKDFGEFNQKVLDSFHESKNLYYICHIQAPTSGMIKDRTRIHPSVINDTYLWHNGIIKPRSVKELQKEQRTDNNFDTKLLHNVLQKYSNLSDIEGLFACVYLNKGLKLFRTKHAKLYIDNNYNISSEQFIDSKCINFDTIYNLDLKQGKLESIDFFKTKRFNIIIPGEL